MLFSFGIFQHALSNLNPKSFLKPNSTSSTNKKMKKLNTQTHAMMEGVLPPSQNKNKNKMPEEIFRRGEKQNGHNPAYLCCTLESNLMHSW